MLSRGEPTGYVKTVATTWSLAFSRLEQSTPTATAESVNLNGAPVGSFY
jgi:hypothetical protein